MRRCGLFVVLFALSLTGLSLSYSNSASAISASMTVTDDTENDYNWHNFNGSNKLRNPLYSFTQTEQQQTDFATEMLGKVDGREVTPENADIYLNNKDYGWAYYGNNFIRFPRGAVAWRCMSAGCTNLELGIRNDVNYADGVWLHGRFTTDSGGNPIISVTYPTQPQSYLPCSTSSSACIKVGGRMNFYQLQHVPEDKQQQFEENVAYGNQDPPEENTDCDALDVVCHLGKIFIPGDDNLFVTAFSDLNDYMRNKLGFLLYPVDFLNSVIRPFFSDTLDTVVKDEFHCNLNSHIYSTHCRGVCAPNVLGDKEVCLRIGELETRFPALWNTMIWFLRVSLVVALIELLRRKYMQIVSN